MREKTEAIRSHILGAITDFCKNNDVNISYEDAVRLTGFIMNSIMTAIRSFKA